MTRTNKEGTASERRKSKKRARRVNSESVIYTITSDTELRKQLKHRQSDENERVLLNRQVQKVINKVFQRQPDRTFAESVARKKVEPQDRGSNVKSCSRK